MSGSDPGAPSRPDSRAELADLLADAVAHVWGDPDATRHDDRRHGVDVHCRPDRLEGGDCGMHCAATDDLSVDAVREAADAAADHDPALDELVVATTAPRDGSVHEDVRSLATERESEDRFPVRVLWLGDVVRLLGAAAEDRGDLDEAEAYLRRGLEAARDRDDREAEAGCLRSLGGVALERGDLEAAEERYDEALSVAEEGDEEHAAATARHRLAAVARERDDWEAARDHLQAASETFLEIGAGHDALGVLDGLVEAYNRTGEEEEAVDACMLAIGVADELDRPEVERQFRVRYAGLPGRDVAKGTDELYSFALENVVDPDPDTAIALFDRTWDRRDEVPAGSGTHERTHAAGVFLAALAELYDLERGGEAVEPGDLLAAATDPDVDLPEPVEPVAAHLGGEDPGVTPDDLDGDVELDEDGEVSAEDLEKLAAAAVLDALG